MPLAGAFEPATVGKGPLADRLLTVTRLSAGYGGAPALVDVDFSVAPGQRVGVLGPNGGGKTTLFRVLLGELAPLRGEVHGPARIGVVPQTERSRLDFPVSALDVALMGTISTLPWWRRPSRADRRRAREALAAVALERHVDQSFGALSGGQRQRVLVARALVQDAPLLLFDEPYTGLDARSAELLDGLLAQLAEGGRAILVATHDVEQARRWDRVLCLNRRQVAFGDPSEALGLDVLEATYGGAVVELSDRRGVLPPHHHDHR